MGDPRPPELRARRNAPVNAAPRGIRGVLMNGRGEGGEGGREGGGWRRVEVGRARTG